MFLFFIRMSFRQITKYEKCDILKHQNDVSIHRFHKDTSLGEMINLALINNCKIIVKNGKYYLKGKDKDVSFLRAKIEECMGSRDGVCCYFIE